MIPFFDRNNLYYLHNVCNHAKSNRDGCKNKGRDVLERYCCTATNYFIDHHDKLTQQAMDRHVRAS